MSISNNNYMEKKLTLFFPSYRRGGLENSLLRIAKLLISNKYKITIIGNDIDKDEFIKSDNLKIININKKFKKSIFKKFFNIHIFQLFISSLICIKYSNIILTFQSPYIMILLNFFYRKKIIIRESNHIEYSTKKNFVMKFFKKMAWNFADLIIFNSQESKLLNSRYLNYKYKNLSILYNPLDFDDVITKSKIKMKFYKKKRAINFVTVARLSYQKNLPYLIELMSKMKGKVDFKLHLIGGGIEKKKIVNLVKKLNLSNDIKLYGHKKNPFPIIKKSDFFILFPNYEGFGNVFLESLILKTPIITWKAPCGTAEILNNGNCGLLLKYKSNINKNLNLILEYIKNDKLIYAHIKNSTKHIQKFNYKKNSISFNKIFLKFKNNN